RRQRRPARRTGASELEGAPLGGCSLARRHLRSQGRLTVMATTIRLPVSGGTLQDYTIANIPLAAPERPAGRHPFNRVAFAAAHVVIDPLADNDPWLDRNIDWERTVAFREYLWDLGLGVAEAMDTAQRGMGLDWAGAKGLIANVQSAARGRPDALIAYGA